MSPQSVAGPKSARLDPVIDPDSQAYVAVVAGRTLRILLRRKKRGLLWLYLRDRRRQLETTHLRISRLSSRHIFSSRLAASHDPVSNLVLALDRHCRQPRLVLNCQIDGAVHEAIGPIRVALGMAQTDLPSHATEPFLA
jgi:hypothetical protein